MQQIFYSEHPEKQWHTITLSRTQKSYKKLFPRQTNLIRASSIPQSAKWYSFSGLHQSCRWTYTADSDVCVTLYVHVSI